MRRTLVCFSFRGPSPPGLSDFSMEPFHQPSVANGPLRHPYCTSLAHALWFHTKTNQSGFLIRPHCSVFPPNLSIVLHYRAPRPRVPTYSTVSNLSTAPRQDRSLLRTTSGAAEEENEEGGDLSSTQILVGGGPAPRGDLHQSTDCRLTRISVGPPGSFRW